MSLKSFFINKPFKKKSNICYLTLLGLTIATKVFAVDHFLNEINTGTHLVNQNEKLLLHVAAKFNDFHQLNKILNSKFSTVIQDKDGNTALHIALQSHHFEWADQLLSFDMSSLTVRNHVGQTPFQTGAISLHDAACAGHSNIVKALLKTRVDVNSKNNTHQTPLHLAVSQGHVAVVEELLKARARTDILSSMERENTSSNTDKIFPIHAAVIAKSPTILKMLLKAGANVNALTQGEATRNSSALQIAASMLHKESVDILLAANANKSLQDSNGDNVFHLAVNAKMKSLEEHVQKCMQQQFELKEKKVTENLYKLQELGFTKEQCKTYLEKIDLQLDKLSIEDEFDGKDENADQVIEALMGPQTIGNAWSVYQLTHAKNKKGKKPFSVPLESLPPEEIETVGIPKGLLSWFL